jgi:hypothetical protein
MHSIMRYERGRNRSRSQVTKKKELEHENKIRFTNDGFNRVVLVCGYESNLDNHTLDCRK